MIVLAAAGLLVGMGQASGAGFESIYKFRGGGNGGIPSAFTADASGAIYGTTHTGGYFNYPADCPFDGCGTVFRLDPPAAPGGAWRHTILHRFRGLGANDGARPFDGVIRDGSGVLYGTTYQGGANGQSQGGYGTVFKLTPPAPGETQWTRRILHHFGNYGDGVTGDGGYPYAGLAMGAGGVLYGATRYGGAAGGGTVFRLTPSSDGKRWSYSVLQHFRSGGGPLHPLGRLAIGKGGRLYGTTEAGGADGYGTVFELSPPAAGGQNWRLQVLHSFRGGLRDGAEPRSGVTVDGSGAIYGSTPYGGSENRGILYKLTRSALGKWTRTVLYGFQGIHKTPEGLLVLDGSGALYGTTVYGGLVGSIYKLVPPAADGGKWKLQELHRFSYDGRQGRFPWDGLFAGKGGLYGITQNGGVGDCNQGCGTIFRYKP